jgi:hypothetical protein
VTGPGPRRADEPLRTAADERRFQAAEVGFVRARDEPARVLPEAVVRERDRDEEEVRVAMGRRYVIGTSVTRVTRVSGARYCPAQRWRRGLRLTGGQKYSSR